MARRSPPLSPHLQVYRWQATLTMSILHRITGMGLVLGMAVLLWWLWAASAGGEALARFDAVAASWFGQLVLFGFTWALFHHMLGGVRHFIWDMGQGFSEAARFGFAWATLIGGIVLTLGVWLVFVWL